MLMDLSGAPGRSLSFSGARLLQLWKDRLDQRTHQSFSSSELPELLNAPPPGCKPVWTCTQGNFSLSFPFHPTWALHLFHFHISCGVTKSALPTSRYTWLQWITWYNILENILFRNINMLTVLEERKFNLEHWLASTAGTLSGPSSGSCWVGLDGLWSEPQNEQIHLKPGIKSA